MNLSVYCQVFFITQHGNGNWFYGAPSGTDQKHGWLITSTTTSTGHSLLLCILVLYVCTIHHLKKAKAVVKEDLHEKHHAPERSLLLSWNNKT